MTKHVKLSENNTDYLLAQAHELIQKLMLDSLETSCSDMANHIKKCYEYHQKVCFIKLILLFGYFYSYLIDGG